MANTEPRALPGLGLNGFWPLGFKGWKPGMDDNLKRLSALVGLSVVSATTALPASPEDGVIYIVPPGATNENKVAVRDAGEWYYIDPPFIGFPVFVRDQSLTLRWTGTAWGVYEIPLAQKNNAGGVAALDLQKRTPYTAFMSADLPNTVRTAFAVNTADRIAIVANNLAICHQHGNNLVGAIVFRAPYRKDGIFRLSIGGRTFNATAASGLIVDTEVTFYSREALGPQSFQVLHKGTLEPQVRVGYQNGNIVVVLNDVTTVVNHGVYGIMQMVASYTGVTETDANGWTSSVVTDLTGYDLTSPTNVYSTAKMTSDGDIAGRLNGTNVVSPVYRQNLPTAANERWTASILNAGIAYNGTTAAAGVLVFRGPVLQTVSGVHQIDFQGGTSTTTDAGAMADFTVRTSGTSSGGLTAATSSVSHRGGLRPIVMVAVDANNRLCVIVQYGVAKANPSIYIKNAFVSFAAANLRTNITDWTAEYAATSAEFTSPIILVDTGSAPISELTPYKGLMAASQDLNAYTYRETWQVPSAAVATGGTNFPIGQAGSFESLAQVTRAGTAVGAVAQRYTGTTSNRAFNRTYSGSAWTAWREFAFLDNPVFTGPVRAQAASTTAGYGELQSGSTGSAIITAMASSTFSSVDLECWGPGTLSEAAVRMFRTSNPSTTARLIIHAADGSASYAHALSAKVNGQSEMCRLSGQKLVIGSGSPNTTDLVYMGGPLSVSGPVRPGQYTLTTLPAAASYSGAIINVTNATGGQKLCMSNGTNWQILNTTTTVS